ncbi:Crp/Fnr family transcriptional regulator [Bacteroidota bacterium]
MVNNINSPCCAECETRWENFNNLSDEELNLICDNRHIAEFQPGEIISKQGAPISSAVFLTKGMAKIYIEGYDNKRMMVGIARQGRLIAGPGTYVDNRHHYTVAALTDVTACFINMEILKKLVHTNGKFAEGWLIDISRKSLKTFYRFLSHTQKKMHGRLAETLLYLADEIHESDEFSMMLSRQELGELSGMAKESVVRILKEFNDDKIIQDKCPHIIILNKDKLKMISNMG